MDGLITDKKCGINFIEFIYSSTLYFLSIYHVNNFIYFQKTPNKKMVREIFPEKVIILM